MICLVLILQSLLTPAWLTLLSTCHWIPYYTSYLSFMSCVFSTRVSALPEEGIDLSGLYKTGWVVTPVEHSSSVCSHCVEPCQPENTIVGEVTRRLLTFPALNLKCLAFFFQARNCLQKLREDISSKLDRSPGDPLHQQEIQVLWNGADSKCGQEGRVHQGSIWFPENHQRWRSQHLVIDNQLWVQTPCKLILLNLSEPK